MSTLSILNEIAEEPSSNAKLVLLKAQTNNETLKRVCELTYGDFLFFIRKIPVYESNPDGFTLDEALKGIVKVLATREKTGNDGITYLWDILSKLKSDDAKVLEKVIKGDLDSGFSKSTINKVWKKLIVDTPYMRCSTQDDKIIKKISYPAFVQTKADGMFLNIILEPGKQPLYKTRGGKLIDFGPKIDAVWESIYPNLTEHIVIHGEGLLMNEDGTTMNRKKGNGLLTSLQKATKPKEELDKIRAKAFFKVWDIVNYKEWSAGKFNVPAWNRYCEVGFIVEKINSSIVRLVETVEVYNYEEALTFYKKMRNNGEEGAILKNKNGIWEDKTSKDLMKMKAEEDCDLMCVGTIPHSKNPSLIGSLVLESSDGKIKVNSGSGLSKEDRERDPSYFIGNIATIKYNERISSKSKESDSLFLPIVIEAPRFDKTEADHSKDIV